MIEDRGHKRRKDKWEENGAMGSDIKHARRRRTERDCDRTDKREGKRGGRQPVSESRLQNASTFFFRHRSIFHRFSFFFDFSRFPPFHFTFHAHFILIDQPPTLHVSKSSRQSFMKEQFSTFSFVILSLVSFFRVNEFLIIPTSFVSLSFNTREIFQGVCRVGSKIEWKWTINRLFNPVFLDYPWLFERWSVSDWESVNLHSGPALALIVCWLLGCEVM